MSSTNWLAASPVRRAIRMLAGPSVGLLLVGCSGASNDASQTTPTNDSEATVVTAPASAVVSAASGNEANGSASATAQSTTVAPSTSVADAVSSSTVAELLNEAGGVAGPVAFWKEYHGGDFECCEMAETGGRLESDQGCLFIWHDEVTSRSLALWPFGTRWDDQTDELITPEGVTVETDAMFESGGGFHAIDMLDDFTTSPAVDSYLRRCAEVGPASLSEIAVVQGNYIVPVAP